MEQVTQITTQQADDLVVVAGLEVEKVAERVAKKGKKVKLSTDDRLVIEDALDQYASPDVTSKERDNINDALEGKGKLTSSSRDIIDSALEEAYQNAQGYEDFENMTTLMRISKKLESL